jgi:hypothetical protein
MLKLFRAFGASFALVLLGALSYAAVTSLPLPAVNGPYLGDFGNNLYAITSNYLAGSGIGSVDLGSVSQTSAQANCTTIASVNSSELHQVTTSAGTGYVCLPTANPGKVVAVYNATGQTIDIYSNATSFTNGTTDKINETAGTTPYTGLTTHKTLICVAAVGGHWGCGSIS